MPDLSPFSAKDCNDFNGDEFMLILPNLNAPDTLPDLHQKLFDKISNPIFYNGYD